VDFTAVDTRWNAAGQVASVEVDPKQVPKTDVRAWNLYLRDSVRLFDERLTLSAGARYDRYDYSPQVDALFQDRSGTVRDVRFASPSWQAGAEWRFVDSQSLWLQVGRGFRAPTVSDMYSPTSTTSVTDAQTGQTLQLNSSVSNIDLEAEKSLNVELGWRWSSDRLLLGASIFRDRYSNFIEYTNQIQEVPGGFRTCATCAIQYQSTYQMPTNSGTVTVKGAELEGRWLIDDQWSTRLAASYSEGEKANGDPLESIVPATAVLGVRYAPSRRWNLNASVTHGWGKSASDAYTTSSTGVVATPAFVDKADGFTTVDLYGTWHITDSLRLSAGVYNLTNQEYYLWQRVRMINRGSNTLYGYVNDEGIGRYSEPGRNVRATLAYSF